MKRLVGIVLAVLIAFVGCGGSQVSLKTTLDGDVELSTTSPDAAVPEAPRATEPTQKSQGPQPYAQDENCMWFHDNDLVGQPYAMGFHYCLYAKSMESIVMCSLDYDDQRSICYNADGNPEVGVQWHESPGIAEGKVYVPNRVGSVGQIHGEVMQVSSNRVMRYTITLIDGTHSECVVGGPTVRYCHIDE